LYSSKPHKEDYTMSTPDLSNVDIDSILADVQDVLVNIAKSEKDRAEKLAKAAGDDEKSKMAADDAGEASAPAFESEDDDKESSKDDAASASPADDPAAPGDEGGDQGSEDDGPIDPSALQAEFAKLPLDQLKMYAEAAQSALAAAMGGGMGAVGPAAGASAPEASAPAGLPPAMKGEMKGSMMKGDGNGGMAKSEAEVASLKKSLEEQGKMLERVIGAFEAVVSKPMRKAETMLTPAASATEKKLSKSEMAAKLRAKVRDTSLTKKDRELINDFFLNGNVDASKLSHLLK
jgi:hypothetical protein